MWTDIDYMVSVVVSLAEVEADDPQDARKVFTLDPERFPLPKVRELVAYLNDHQQHYIVMVDPAVAYQDYPAFNDGRDIFMKTKNGSVFAGVVWPGTTAWPDFFHPDAQTYWNEQFESFFNPETGVDISGLWIDMNEAAKY